LILNWHLLTANSTAARSSFSGKILTQGLAFFFWPSNLSHGIIARTPLRFFKGNNMAHELDPNEIVDFRELVMTNTIQVDTMYQLLIQKGYFTEAEFLVKMKEVQRDYQRKS
jgi:hypothetical protein